MIFYYSVLVLFLFFAFLLIAIIMLQEGKNLGLGASFGADSKDSLFGIQTAEVLKKVTAYLAFIFMLLCVLLSFWTAHIGEKQTATMHPGVEQAQMPSESSME